MDVWIYNSFQETQSKKIVDVVLRSNSVVNIIPYFSNNGNIEILAKYGYPRPIVNIETDSPVIDQKHYSGYIIEGLTAANNQPIEPILKERANIGSQNISKIENSLEYFTYPGGINEKVESIFVALKIAPQEEMTVKNYSGFTDSGSIRKYDAIQLLKTAQTGALVEARLELNIYNLLRKLNVNIPQWLGEKIEIETLPTLKISALKSILEKKKIPLFRQLKAQVICKNTELSLRK